MRKRSFGAGSFICVLLCGLLAAVCLRDTSADKTDRADKPDSIVASAAESAKPIVFSDSESMEPPAADTAEPGIEISEIRKAQEGLYAYDSLTEEEQVLYAELFAILNQMAEEVPVASTDEDIIGKVFQCVLNDHPELFYVEGYQITKYTTEDVIKRITFTGTYAMTREEAGSRKERIEQYVKECLGGMPQDADDYEKVKYIYEYLILHTEYQLESAENQTICSVFLYGESVCQGYAKAMQYLCRRAGVNATLVVGTVDNGEGHAWNLVQIDGAYYYVDATWGDAFYVFEPSDSTNAESTGKQENLPNINYDYLCVTTEQIAKTHQIDNIVPMPRCVSTEANYYVREGAYFTHADMEMAEKLFEQAYAQSKEAVTLKCIDEAVYSEMRRLLITEQKVFDYLKSGENTIAYTENEAQLTLSFCL